MAEQLGKALESLRDELTAYLCRLVIRPALAEELAQTTYLRCLEASATLPDTADGQRAWLFKVATHLAIDEQRRHGNWREEMLSDLRTRALADAAFVAQSKALASTAETRAIAREHLVACFACTLRNLPERKAAAVLLKEVHGFSLVETAEILDARAAQVKNWLQDGRAFLQQKYGSSCALIAKRGACHQCVELDGFMAAGQGNPLVGAQDIGERLRIVAELRARPWGAWHRLMFQLIDELGR